MMNRIKENRSSNNNYVKSICLAIVLMLNFSLQAQLSSDEFWKDIPLVRESGVPLGGIGAGKVDLCPDGAFRNMTFQNNIDVPISGLKSDQFSEVGLPEAFFAIAVEGTGAKMLKEKDKKGLPKGFKMEEITYKGLYPFVSMEFPDFGEMGVELEVFSPLLLDDPHPQYLNSSLPSFIGTVKLTNKSSMPKKVGALFSWPSIIGLGGYPKTRVMDPRGNEMHPSNNSEGASVLFTHSKAKLDQRVEGEMYLRAVPSKNTKLTTEVNFWWHERFNKFGETCDLPETVADEVLSVAGAVKTGSMGAVAGTKTIQPGETFEQRFILSWYFPHRKANDNPDVVDTNFYAAHFDSVESVTKYVQDNFSMLYDGTKRWQKQFENSNLPDWLSIKLVNNISTLSANTIYLTDGRFSVNEAPTSMRGCMGTIDQRAASHSIYSFAFPNLAKSELIMFNNTQITKDSKERYSPHWNMKTGKFDMKLDRFGAIKHDIGRDDFEGGMGPSNHWKTTHWPDIGAVYVLQSYAQAAWTNDREYLKEVYPKMLAALEFQKQLDQNNNGIADLWGNGCCTYDSKIFRFFGDAPFIATLHLAAIRAAQKTAEILGDDANIKELEADFVKNRKTLDSLLWNDEKGHYNKYVDLLYKTCDGTAKEHPMKSTNNMIAQIAGNWFVNQLNLDPILDQDKIDKVLKSLYRDNVASAAFTPHTETGPDDRHAKYFPHSWPYYAETYFAANAIYEGRVDEGMDMEKRFAKGMFQHSGQIWDARLRWSGEGNGEQGWGRWYMSTPASWFVLQALAGVHYDGLTQTLTVNPAKWSELKKFDQVPVFHPLFWATISTDKKGWTLEINKLLNNKTLAVKEIIVAEGGDKSIYVNAKKLKTKQIKTEKGKTTYQLKLSVDEPLSLSFK